MPQFRSSGQALLQVRPFLEKMVSLTQAEWDAFASQVNVKYIPRKEHFLRQGEICR